MRGILAARAFALGGFSRFSGDHFVSLATLRVPNSRSPLLRRLCLTHDCE
jgi:hypothetical protein